MKPHRGENYERIFQDIYHTIIYIQAALLKNPFIHNIIPTNPTVKDYLECYISFINGKCKIKNNEKTIKIYKNSYNIFVLQQQEILPKIYDFREESVKHPSYFFIKFMQIVNELHTINIFSP